MTNKLFLAVSAVLLLSALRATPAQAQDSLYERYPSFRCAIEQGNQLCSLSVHELDNLIEADSTWRTGKWWGGVWTRDVNYSAFLAAAYMDPLVTRTSLMKKVWKGRILQDTGTGGSWPISTDRIVWALGAWQLYLVTRDEDWLRQSRQIICNTLRQDELTVYDSTTGLMRGESSFLDWREETYPRWMQPADIAQSECLGTNALFFQAYRIAADMSDLLGDPAAASDYRAKAAALREAVNRHLWMEDKGYYAQYLYGRAYPILSPRSETLGEALCILFGIADSSRARRIVCSLDLTPYGTPCISPQIPNIYPYHNNAVWPFVQAFWMHAAARAGNWRAVEHSIAAINDAALRFGTNQENFVAATGSRETAMNSPNMLWSICGSLSIYHRLLCGVRFEADGLRFAPFVPEAFAGVKSLSRFPCGRALLDITVEGWGDRVAAFYLDGKRRSLPLVPPTLKGRHSVRVVMNNAFAHNDTVRLRPVSTSPEMTYQVFLDGTDRLGWRQVPESDGYVILCNGQRTDTVPERLINGDRHPLPYAPRYRELQVIALRNGIEGFASEPLPCYNPDDEQQVCLSNFAPAADFAPCKGFGCAGAVEIAAGVNDSLLIEVNVAQAGEYLIDFRYANGSDNLTDNNRSANRALYADGRRVGNIVFPQRGKGLWSLWGYSTSVRLRLSAGPHQLLLTFQPQNENMSREGVNRAFLDHLRLIRLPSAD
uniref:Putative glycogen debranching protein n=1 Tax=uncultured bacterium fosmid pJB17E7_contig I TaxID=1478055 RepID=A0A0H3U9G7_9BACT|nr:putative glycogen debranching protein [uncultured bacterium fosmid pJB17E7_contig I]